MKNTFRLLLICLLTSTNSFSQSGVILFDEKTKLNIDVDSDNQEVVNNLPKEHTSKKELIFNSDASYFHKIEKVEDEEMHSDDGHHKMVIKFDEPDNKIYCDLKEKKRIEQRDFMSRKFLLEIPFSASAWKVTGKQKDILGYHCQEAILQDSVRKVKAWFASQIPVSTGPNGVCNLPGMVLGAEFNDGEQVFEATKVELKEVDAKLIVRPTEGKKMTREEYNKMVVEKQKEMEEENGGKGNVIIKIKK